MRRRYLPDHTQPPPHTHLHPYNPLQPPTTPCPIPATCTNSGSRSHPLGARPQGRGEQRPCRHACDLRPPLCVQGPRRPASQLHPGELVYRLGLTLRLPSAAPQSPQTLPISNTSPSHPTPHTVPHLHKKDFPLYDGNVMIPFSNDFSWISGTLYLRRHGFAVTGFSTNRRQPPPTAANRRQPPPSAADEGSFVYIPSLPKYITHRYPCRCCPLLALRLPMLSPLLLPMLHQAPRAAWRSRADRRSI